jgi:hypothetical protein
MPYIVMDRLTSQGAVTAEKADTVQQTEKILVYLKNTTKYSDREIARILEFSMPIGVPDFDATVTKRFQDRFRGTGYPFGCWLHKVNRYKPLIIARISGNEDFFLYWVERGDSRREAKRLTTVGTDRSVFRPHKLKRRGYVSTLLSSTQECLIYVIAHELRHLYQAKYKAGWVYDSKGKRSSERDADAYAIAKVREWRRKNMAREVEQAFFAASIFLSPTLLRITVVLSSIVLNRRRSTIEQ